VFRAIFSKKLKELITHPLHGFSVLLLYFCGSKNICSPQFAHPMTQKLFNWAEELVKYWKLFSGRYLFGDGRFYAMALQN
jgi:hypothetical protein